VLAGQRNLSVCYPMAFNINQRDISCGFPTIFVSAVESFLRQNGAVADVILFVLCQIGFASRVSNREQAFQANRVERTIFVSSVWEKMEA
jgi:hypothetical protein